MKYSIKNNKCYCSLLRSTFEGPRLLGEQSAIYHHVIANGIEKVSAKSWTYFKHRHGPRPSCANVVGCEFIVNSLIKFKTLFNANKPAKMD